MLEAVLADVILIGTVLVFSLIFPSLYPDVAIKAIIVGIAASAVSHMTSFLVNYVKSKMD